MEKKTQNYTPEQTQQIVQFYQDGQSVEMIAEAVGKSVRSVVAKLSREGVYKAKSYVSKTGEKPVKKDVVADEIAAILLLTEAETESLTKANKTALAKILAAVRWSAVEGQVSGLDHAAWIMYNIYYKLEKAVAPSTVYFCLRITSTPSLLYPKGA